MNMEIKKMDKLQEQQNELIEIMEQYGREVVWLAYSYVKNEATAEDLAQDVFVKCYEKLSEFRFESALKTWLFRITINQCKDYLRSAQFRRMIPSIKQEHFSDSKDKTPEEMTVRKDESSTLADHVLALPRKYREVVILHYFEELKTKKISELLSIKEGTVKTRLRKARKLLKAEYEANEDGE